MPRNGLAFAVRVRGQQDIVGALGRRLELGQHLLFADDDLVGFGEPVFDVDAHLLGQVFDVPFGGEDLVAGAEVLLDGLCLGRRLHHHKCLAHNDSHPPQPGRAVSC
jgi:hypothetical protein